ncbi:ribosome quality control complex subunit TCF25 isoform X2 [Bacillus rossius redtenbacheri]|uniref:ribosome quality control complex subunit TCF25 isoform X2 n=1 Tax=Bacillus rossius redtenbacheri TaxID=93214 RepID=UPI002FDCB676
MLMFFFSKFSFIEYYVWIYFQKSCREMASSSRKNLKDRNETDGESDDDSDYVPCSNENDSDADSVDLGSGSDSSDDSSNISVSSADLLLQESRVWCDVDMQNIPPAPPRFLFTGLSMKCTSVSPSGIMNFDYEHSAFYQKIQLKFFEAVDSYHPENVVAVSHKHPYHVDTLIQLSDLCKLSEDLQMAAELNERALYCLESAFHANFNPTTGRCRLDYRRQENRALYVALFKHVMFVAQRGCLRTALELSKLLLSLDPEGDPMGVLLCIDLFALRSHAHQWLVDLYRLWEPSRNLSQLPNHAFSVAMAQFRLGAHSHADALLQNALLMFPGVLPLLLDKCSVEAAGRIAKHRFFRPDASDSQSLMQLMQLFVHRNHLLWKERAVLDWLMECASRVVERVDADDPLAAECCAKRELRYVGTPRNVLRHILLSDIKEVHLVLPEVVQGGVLGFDPLPPLDSKDLYSRVERPRPQDNGGGTNTSTVLATFFRSLMPTFTVEQHGQREYDMVIQPGHGAEVVAEGGGGAAALELQQSVTSLVDAMRDLLSNVRLPQTSPPATLHQPAGSDYESDDSGGEDFRYFHTFDDDEQH